MIIKDNNQTVTIAAKEADLKEKMYSAQIILAQLIKDVKTEYGYKIAVDITYLIQDEVVEVEKKERFIVSTYSTSRWMQFVKQAYGMNNPTSINLNELVGKECTVTIKHNTDVAGNVYANIAERQF